MSCYLTHPGIAPFVDPLSAARKEGYFFIFSPPPLYL